MSALQASENVYECDVCEYRYEASQHGGVELDEQDGWECPDCQAGIDHFQIVVPPTDDLIEEEADDSDGNEPTLDPHDRSIYRERADETVASLKRKYDKGRLNPQPDFQRYQVWTRKKNSRLIESILLDLPLPMFYFAQQRDGAPTVVIDGQQRLMAIFDFLDGKYALIGLGLFRQELEGKKFKDLDENLQEAIEDFKLSIVEILRESDERIKFDLFERLNTGAVSLNDQELRNSVYRGEYNEFLKRLATTPTLRKLLNLKAAHKRMADVEFVLRYMAFREQTYLKHDDKKTGRFLNRTMERGAALAESDPAASAKEMKDSEADFKKALANVLTIFGDKAFRRFTAGTESNPKGGWEKKVNRALMDVQLYVFSQYDKNVITRNRDALHERLLELMGEDGAFSDLIRHTISEKKRVIGRFRFFEDAVAEVLAEDDEERRLFSRKAKEALYKVSPTCSICGQKIADIDDAHVDHVQPYSKGGKTNSENAALAHRYCNMAKGAKDEATA